MKAWTLALAGAAALAWPATASAQIRASEPAMVAQTIDGTRITLEYSRPRARSRDSLYGKIVTWGEVWTPGANWATTLEASKSVRVNGRPLPAGKYSVWIVVRKEGPWTLVLDPRHRRFHTMHPDSTAEQVRVDVERTATQFTEALTWSFSGLSPEGATLAMEWGTVRIPIEIKVTASMSVLTPAEKAAPFLGAYTFAWSGGPDTGKPITLFITHENGSLLGRWDPAPFPEWDRFFLIPLPDGSFIPGFLEKGKLYDVERDMVFEFVTAGGQATEFKVRAEKDQVIASGRRKS